MLVGQYDYAIDAKGRLNFPARFRDAMGETFIVTRKRAGKFRRPFASIA